jgi:FKBP-type peptidyl-prolyl cis-trans isomerase
MTKWINLLLVTMVIALGSCLDKDDPNAKLNKEIKAIDEFLAITAPGTYVAYDPFGTRLAIQDFGQGPPPHTGQRVVVNYTARLFPDGTVFDGGTINTEIENIEMVGLRRGIASLLEGTSAVLYIPSDYAFGSKGTATVPPNTTVAYSVYLEKVEKTTSEIAQFQVDTAAIKNYLEEKSIDNATEHPSGFWYTVDAVGTGIAPRTYDGVTFQFKGLILSNASIFDEGTVSNQTVFSLIDGLKIGIPLLEEGGSATFYIPSGLGYGPQGSTGVIPPNANLIFEVKLNSVLR